MPKTSLFSKDFQRTTAGGGAPPRPADRALRRDHSPDRYTAGGLPGSRILQRPAIPISDDTLIRAIKRSENTLTDDPVRSLGVDDWACRKGQNYGTIFVDLDKHRVIDLLPDRSAESVQAWLEKAPAEAISRDRCGIYAEAAHQGAATALQVADWFHLLMNLSAAIKRTLEERSSELCLSAEVQQPVPVESSPDTEKRTTLVEQRKPQRRARRLQRYERVIELYQLGHTQPAIRVEVGIERKTIRRWLRAGQFPERKAPSGRRSHVRESHSYLEQRWNEGCHNATQLLQEIRVRGYRGSRQMVSNYVSPWRAQPWSRSLVKNKKPQRIAPRHAAILAGRPAERLSEQQRAL